MTAPRSRGYRVGNIQRRASEEVGGDRGPQAQVCGILHIIDHAWLALKLKYELTTRLRHGRQGDQAWRRRRKRKERQRQRREIIAKSISAQRERIGGDILGGRRGVRPGSFILRNAVAADGCGGPRFEAAQG